MKDQFPLDIVAKDLAAEAGETWTAMTEFPGYSRNVWREEAKLHVGKHLPGARIECLPPSWDGRDGVCIIHPA